MRLFDRGVRCGNVCDLTTADSDADTYGCHRDYQFYYPRHIPVAIPIVGFNPHKLSINLHGAVTHHTVNNQIVDFTMDSSTNSAMTNNSSSARANRKQLLQQVAETHRDNIRKRLEHRLAVARERGDQALIQLLEAEYQQFA